MRNGDANPLLALRLRISVDPREMVREEVRPFMSFYVASTDNNIIVVVVVVAFGNTSTRVLIASQCDNAGSSRQGDEIVFVQMSKRRIYGIVIALKPERLAHLLVTNLVLSRVAAAVSPGCVQGNHSLVMGQTVHVGGQRQTMQILWVQHGLHSMGNDNTIVGWLHFHPELRGDARIEYLIGFR